MSTASLWHKTMQMLRRLKTLPIEAFNNGLRSNHCTDIFPFFSLAFSRFSCIISFGWNIVAPLIISTHITHTFFSRKQQITHIFWWSNLNERATEKKGEEIMRNDLMRCQKKCKLKRVLFLAQIMTVIWVCTIYPNTTNHFRYWRQIKFIMFLLCFSSSIQWLAVYQ